MNKNFVIAIFSGDQKLKLKQRNFKKNCHFTLSLFNSVSYFNKISKEVEI